MEERDFHFLGKGLKWWKWLEFEVNWVWVSFPWAADCVEAVKKEMYVEMEKFVCWFLRLEMNKNKSFSSKQCKNVYIYIHSGSTIECKRLVTIYNSKLSHKPVARKLNTIGYSFEDLNMLIIEHGWLYSTKTAGKFSIYTCTLQLLVPDSLSLNP